MTRTAEIIVGGFFVRAFLGQAIQNHDFSLRVVAVDRGLAPDRRTTGSGL